jgi:hypothetical protein
MLVEKPDNSTILAKTRYNLSSPRPSHASLCVTIHLGFVLSESWRLKKLPAFCFCQSALKTLPSYKFFANCILGLKFDIFFGLNIEKIGMCGVILESTCHHANSGVFWFQKKVQYHSVLASVSGSFARHCLAFSGLFQAS